MPTVVHEAYCCSVVTVNNKNSVQLLTFGFSIHSPLHPHHAPHCMDGWTMAAMAVAARRQRGEARGGRQGGSSGEGPAHGKLRRWPCACACALSFTWSRERIKEESIPLFHTTIPYHSKKNQKNTKYQYHTSKCTTLGAPHMHTCPSLGLPSVEIVAAMLPVVDSSATACISSFDAHCGAC